MYISEISIKNYRNIKDLKIELREGLNVLLGENNIGKTNILEALRLAINPSFANGSRIEKRDFYCDPRGQTTNDPIRIDVVFSRLTAEERAEFVEILNFNPRDAGASTASIHFECAPVPGTDRFTSRRWGGTRERSESSVPDEVYSSIMLTFLDAMRDAVTALGPGRNSRLGKLLHSVSDDPSKASVEAIFNRANHDLARENLITGVEQRLNAALFNATGPQMKQSVQVRSSEPDFEQIVRNLRIVLKLESAAGAETTIRELRQNGLGYNNLLYIATVLAELESTRDATLPVFLVEEPEAHLHPQLQSVLTKFLAEGLHGERRNVQTIVTTHSPTIASEVPFKAIVSLYRKRDGFLGSFPFFKAGLSVAEERKIKRMLDVTRASMLFARGVVFVEGVTEHVLLPVLANRLGKDLHASHISVVPVHGVNFETLGRLFGPGRIDIPVSIITDGDPTVEHVAGVPETWRTEIPAGFANDTYPPADRIANVRALEENNASLRVLVSSVTLEYDMALAAMNNGLVMCDTWRSLGRTYVLDREDVVAAGTAKDRALLVWRGICRSSTPRSKAEFAHALAETLLEKNVAGEFVIGAADFTVPAYIVEALAHAVPD